MMKTITGEKRHRVAGPTGSEPASECSGKQGIGVDVLACNGVIVVGKAHEITHFVIWQMESISWSLKTDDGV